MDRSASGIRRRRWKDRSAPNPAYRSRRLFQPTALPQPAADRRPPSSAWRFHRTVLRAIARSCPPSIHDLQILDETIVHRLVPVDLGIEQAAGDHEIIDLLVTEIGRAHV